MKYLIITTLSILFILNPFSSFSADVFNIETSLFKGGKDSVITTQGKTTIITIYQNNTMIEVISLVDNKKEGLQEKYHYNGTLVFKNNYKNGHQDGESISYDYKGNIVEKRYYKYSKAKGHSLLQKKYEKYQNSLFSIEAYYKDSLLNGKKLEYINGVLSKVANYKNGLLNGEVKTFNYRGGKLLTIQNYKIIGENNKKRSVLHGKYIEYDNNGNIHIIGKYINGLKNGLWKTSHRNITNIKSEIKYKDDLRYGIYIEYYTNGNIKSEGILYQEWLPNTLSNYNRDNSRTKDMQMPNRRKIDKYDGEIKDYFTSGTLSLVRNYTKGKKNGVEETYYNSGSIKQTLFYKDDLVTGKRIYFGIEGDTINKTSYKIILKDSVRTSVKHGMDRRWKYKRITLEENWFEGKKQGRTLSYYPNGQISQEMNFNNNLLVGKYIDYYENGNIKSDKTYGVHITASKKPKAEAIGWRYDYLEDGSLSIKYFYANNGQTLYTISYHNNKIKHIQYGNIIMAKFFPDGKLMSIFIYSRHSQPSFAQYYYRNGQTRIISFQNHETTAINQLIFSDNGKLLTTNSYANQNPDSLLPSSEIINKYTNAVGFKRLDNTFYNDSIRNGDYTLYYANGRPMCKIHLKDELLHGEFILFDALNGDTLKFANFNEGKQQGLYLEKFAGKITVEEGELYKNGKIKWMNSYSNKGLATRKVEYDTTGRRIQYSEYYPNGKIKSNVNLTQGSNLRYDIDGNLLNVAITKGNLIIAKTYFPITMKLQTASYFIDEKKDSIWSKYYPSGKLQYSIQYKQDKRDGEYIYYYKDGNIRTKGQYKNDLGEGAWITYKNGVSDTIYYIKGKAVVRISKAKCSCIDTTTTKIRYMRALTNLIDYQSLISQLPNYIKSLDSNVYKSLNYRSHYGSSGSFSLDLYMPKKLSIEVPADKQLRITFNPCYTKGYPSKMHISKVDEVYYSFKSVVLYPKRISIEFIKGPLKSADGNYEFFTALFNIERFKFSISDIPQLKLAKDPGCCFSNGIINDYLAINVIKATPKIFESPYVKSSVIKKEELSNFFGIEINSADISFNYSKNQQEYTIKAVSNYMLAGGNFVAGRIQIKCIKLGVDNYKISNPNGDLNFSSQELKVEWLKRGFTRLNLFYEEEAKALIIDFFVK